MTDQNDVPGGKGGEDDQGPNVVTFVGWAPNTEEQSTKAPRLNHRKSRNGCQQCRTRRVKCNEVHPTCGSCVRHNVMCVWGRTSTVGPSPASQLPEPSLPNTKTFDIRIKPNLSVSNPKATPVDPPESLSRRLLELKLMHQYMAVTGPTYNLPGASHLHDWAIRTPALALEHPALLYSIYTFTSLHLSHLHPSDPQWSATYQTYLSLTLRDHKTDVQNLSKLNADAAFLTASFLRICTIAMLRTREMEPYAPPMEWLSMHNVANRSLGAEAWKYVADEPDSIMRAMIVSVPGLDSSSKLQIEGALYGAGNREGLEYLLHRSPEQIDHESWSSDIQTTYERGVSVIGVIRKARERGEEKSMVFRRCLMFPATVDQSYVELLREGRERALVVLAHYFAELGRFERVWWVGGVGRREIEGIQGVVGAEWREVLGRLLEEVKVGEGEDGSGKSAR